MRYETASRFIRPSAVLLAFAVLAGCATVTVSGEDTENDPYEPFNRRVFAFNRQLDRAVIRPAAEWYRKVLPQFVRDRVRGILNNLGEPLIFVNDVLQLREEAIRATFARFVINSTVGLGGMFDRASVDGFKRQTGDFGQTLYRWGAQDGPYLVLPFFGPSNVRDAFGLGVDLVSSPVSYALPPGDRLTYGVTTGVVDGIDTRERNLEALDVLEQSAIDFYIHLRSVWRQHRASILRDARKDATTDELLDPAPPPR